MAVVHRLFVLPDSTGDRERGRLAIGGGDSAAAAGLVGLWRWNRTAFFLAGFAVIVFLPTSNLLFPIGTIRADRFLYLPAVGVLGCVVMAVYWLGSRMRSPLVAPAILLAMTAGFAVRTWARNAEWRDELTLASADVETSPRSFKLHRLLAMAMFAADPSHANIDRVVEEIDRSLAIVDPLPDLRERSRDILLRRRGLPGERRPAANGGRGRCGDGLPAGARTSGEVHTNQPGAGGAGQPGLRAAEGSEIRETCAARWWDARSRTLTGCSRVRISGWETWTARFGQRMRRSGWLRRIPGCTTWLRIYY